MLQLTLNVALKNSVLVFLNDILNVWFSLQYYTQTSPDKSMLLTQVLCNIWETYHFLSFLI